MTLCAATLRRDAHSRTRWLSVEPSEPGAATAAAIGDCSGQPVKGPRGSRLLARSYVLRKRRSYDPHRVGEGPR